MDKLKINQVQEYVRKNIVAAKNGRKCVDGRYKAGDGNSGMIARPGGDAGYLEIILALKQQGKLEGGVEVWIDRLIQALKELNEQFYAHTDSHADSSLDSFTIGCGHLAKATNEELARDYLVNPEAIQQAIKDLKKLADQGVIKLVILEGEHKEQAVLVNTGLEKTVNSQDGDQMFFVYDKARDMEFMEKLFDKLNLEGVTLEEFKKISDTQLNATLKNLASGLPVFEVNADLDDSEIKFIPNLE